MALSARLDMSRAGGAFDDWYRFAEQRMERAALIATDRAATQGKADVRAAMSSAGIGRLGNAIDRDWPDRFGDAADGGG